MYQPQNGWAEQDPKDWYNAAVSTIRRELKNRGLSWAANGLKKLAGKFVHSPPRSLAVVVGVHGVAYRRDDGVYVLPLTALRD